MYNNNNNSNLGVFSNFLEYNRVSPETKSLRTTILQYTN